MNKRVDRQQRISRTYAVKISALLTAHMESVLEPAWTKEPSAVIQEAQPSVPFVSLHLPTPTCSVLVSKDASNASVKGICDNGACITSIRADTGVVDCYE